MLDKFLLIKEKPIVKQEYIIDIDYGEYRLINGNYVRIDNEVNNTYVLNYFGENNDKDPIDFLIKSGFIQGKFIEL